MTNGQMAIVKARVAVIKMKELRDILLELEKITLDIKEFVLTHAVEFSKSEKEEYIDLVEKMEDLEEQVSEWL